MGTFAGKVVSLKKGLNALFVKSFNNAEDPADVMAFITTTSSTSDGEDYGWLGQAPSMSEWIDERKLKTLNEFEYTIKNKSYEGTISIKRENIEDDKLGAAMMRVEDLGRKARIHPRKLFIDLLAAGEVDLCYDGQPFFSLSHEEGKSGVQSNLLTGTGTSLSQLEADIDAAEEAMLGFKDDTGEPWNEGDVKIGIVCHTSLKNKFFRLNTLDLINNTTNSMKGRISRITYSSRFSDKNDWYMGDVSEGVKAVIMQKRKDPQFVGMEDDSQDGFMRAVFHYGVDYRVGFGYGLWQKMVKTKNT